jgi:hypothetical protein
MKVGKTTALAASFCLGAVMLVTTAFADVTAKTGYDQLKDSIKYTANSCAESLQNFSFEATMTLKDNDQVLNSANFLEKLDTANGKHETINVEERRGEKKRSYYSYSDKKCCIRKDSSNDIYYVTEFANERSGSVFQSPFKEERAADMERIFDALVGNLKNYVMVDEKPDGSQQLSGTVSEAQIPALVNAFSSLVVKEQFSNSRTDDNEFMPQISRDIVVKTVKGKALINKDGLLESILGSAIITGKDKNGDVHELTLEVLVKIQDVNSTKIVKPDLTGKKVEKHLEKLAERVPLKNFIGTYKNDIVIVKENKFEKIGERTIEIAHVDEQNVGGRYYEQYKDGYNEYSDNALDFQFDAKVRDERSAEFKFTNPDGHENDGRIYFNESCGKIYFNFDSGNQYYDAEFRCIFNN